MSKKGEANQQVDGLLNNVSIHLLVFFKAELKKGLQCTQFGRQVLHREGKPLQIWTIHKFQGLQGWECYMRITQVGKLSVVP